MHPTEKYLKLVFMFWSNAWSLNETFDAYRSQNWSTFIFTGIFAMALLILSIIAAKLQK